MVAYVFPGQGSQFEGMGKDLYDSSEPAKRLFEKANEILGFRISDIMFNGTAEELKETKVTQPAVFLYSAIKYLSQEPKPQPDCVAGHSLGEFTALMAAGALSFEDALKLVSLRATAMQRACEEQESTMAAIVGLDNHIIERICSEIDGIVVPANYNCPGQLVISGEVPAVELAAEQLKEAGARRALLLPVGGAFHSPLMAYAKEELASAISLTNFNTVSCPIYQNFNAKSVTETSYIKENLVNQLTGAVKWTQIMQQMLDDGVTEVVEVGAKVLSGFFKRIDRKFPVSQL